METRGDVRATPTNTLKVVWLNAGDAVSGEDVYVCFNCGEPHPPVVSLHRGEKLPPCTNCGDNARWIRV